MTFRLTRDARADIDEIWDYTVETWGEAQAETYLTELTDRFDQAVRFPDAGQDRSQMLSGMRSFAVRQASGVLPDDFRRGCHLADRP